MHGIVRGSEGDGRRQVDRWGAVLCMGFVYFRAAGPTVRAVRQVVAEMLATDRPDDQVRASPCIGTRTVARELLQSLRTRCKLRNVVVRPQPAARARWP